MLIQWVYFRNENFDELEWTTDSHSFTRHIFSSGLSNLYFSAAAAGIAEVLTLPICTIKTNYQNTTNINISQTIRAIWQRGGIREFYKAATPAVGGQMVSSASKYFLYRRIESNHFFGDNILNKMICGSMSGILSSIVTHPLDTIKIHRQMKKPFGLDLKKEGLGLFYRGYNKTFAKILFSAALFFPIYDLCYEQTTSPMVSAFTSALISTTLMQPIDYFKTREIYGLPLYNKNVGMYFKGLELNLMQVIPHFMIMMCAIEYLQRIGQSFN